MDLWVCAFGRAWPFTDHIATIQTALYGTGPITWKGSHLLSRERVVKVGSEREQCGSGSAALLNEVTWGAELLSINSLLDDITFGLTKELLLLSTLLRPPIHYTLA
ncbi:unnamed protein product [Boreogadus saida]